MIIPLEKCYENIKRFAFKNLELKTDCKILDIGCGLRGNFWQFASQSYIGLDVNRIILKKLEKRENGTYKLHDLRRGLPYPDEFFDYVVSVSFFHHFSDQQAGQLIRQIKHVLSHKGRAIMVDGVYPDSLLNFPGMLIRYLDRGRYVRNADKFEQLFLKEFDIEKKYRFTESIFAYTALLLRPKNDGT
ncbi:MAG: class I SAM-dependent methyltransferase [Candidatus Omnitrophica bacterium]|nr:class I SAM-dependent methyltransferase [Candidatus Omnitrophota bacterium]